MRFDVRVFQDNKFVNYGASFNFFQILNALMIYDEMRKYLIISDMIFLLYWWRFLFKKVSHADYFARFVDK